MIRVRPALILAVVATGTAMSMSLLAGWQRGGWLAERLVWVAIGVVLVTGAHLLPSLCRSAPLSGHVFGAVLWLGCIGAASYGHATFFLLSQLHAGELRVSAIPVVGIPPHRELTAVMADRASVTGALARVDARRCIRDCPTWQARRTSLAARLDALDAEADDIRRYQTIEDGNAEHRMTARDDPVTARLAMFCGIPEARLDLFAGLGFAAVLEGLACLLWWVALAPQVPESPITDRHGVAHDVTTETAPVTMLAQSPSPTTIQSTVPPVVQPTVTFPESDLARLRHDIESGAVKPTVAGIRRHLGCSQARASVLRRQLADLTA
ncbi:putative twin-arginine translocation pathway signal protein [Burkholderia pseudomallei]|nr:putative twin-arginine translocation pathway signal protein [Burkholderia pseudomallei]